MNNEEIFIERLTKVITLDFDVWVNRGLTLELNKFNNRVFMRQLRFQRKYNIKTHYLLETSHNLFLAAKYLLYEATYIANKMGLSDEIELIYGNVEDLFTAVASHNTGATIDDIQDALLSADDSFMVDSRIRYINMMMKSQNHQYN